MQAEHAVAKHAVMSMTAAMAHVSRRRHRGLRLTLSPEAAARLASMTASSHLVSKALPMLLPVLLRLLAALASVAVALGLALLAAVFLAVSAELLVWVAVFIGRTASGRRSAPGPIRRVPVGR